jgi:ribosomal protein L12E/L44/L45/RPP1/RPP2
MEPIITPTLLVAAGITIPEDQIEALLESANDQLDERIGTEITESLEDDQLEELVTLQTRGDDEAVADWLAENVPELEQIIQDETDIMLGEIAANAKNVNEA